MPKVSVIIPVYGVESYIERCARSLFEQTLDDIEYLFIDDCTPDKSVDILNKVLQEYPNRKNQVTIHRMDCNSGQALVRKWGMLNATGDYVIHCDSDDWVDIDMYRVLYEKAIEHNADVAICDFARTDGNKCNVECGCHSEVPAVFIENCLFQKDKWSLCNKLFKKDCFQNIAFPRGALGEDMMMCLQMLYNVKRIGYVKKTLYYYYYNPNSLTKKRTVENCIKQYNTLFDNTDFVVRYIESHFTNRGVDVQLASKYLRMNNLLSLVYVKHLPEYKKLWQEKFIHMPFRFYINKKISLYFKVVYVLSAIGIYPPKRERIDY